jgi:hypothetical protein
LSSANQFPKSVLSRSRILVGKYVYSISDSSDSYSYSYYLIDLPVYEDGVVKYHNYFDLNGLKEKISSGRLTPTMPDGKRLTIMDVGCWEIESAEWLYTKSTYYDFIFSIVQSMNPDLTNLFKDTGKPPFAIGNSEAAPMIHQERYLSRQDGERPTLINFQGERQHYFYKIDDDTYELCNLDVYSDSNVLVEQIDASALLKLSEVGDLIDKNILTTRIPDGSIVIIKDLGKVKISRTITNVDVREMYKETLDIIARQNKVPTFSDICYQCFVEYNKVPNEENRERLRAAYEKVPTHLRMFILGDTDRRDYEIRKIIYGE